MAAFTRVTGNSATLIDQIWTTNFEDNISNYIVYADITDHFAVYSQFKRDHKFDAYVEKKTLL